MAGENEKSLRSWQEIAEEASKERDPEKLLKLTSELEHALDKRDEELARRKGAGSIQHSPSEIQQPSSRSKGA